MRNPSAGRTWPWVRAPSRRTERRPAGAAPPPSLLARRCFPSSAATSTSGRPRSAGSRACRGRDTARAGGGDNDECAACGSGSCCGPGGGTGGGAGPAMSSSDTTRPPLGSPTPAAHIMPARRRPTRTWPLGRPRPAQRSAAVASTRDGGRGAGGVPRRARGLRLPRRVGRGGPPSWRRRCRRPRQDHGADAGGRAPARAAGDVPCRRRGPGHRHSPRGPGRDGNGQVAGLPDPRRAQRQEGRGRHSHQGAAGPAGREGPAPDGVGPGAPGAR